MDLLIPALTARRHANVDDKYEHLKFGVIEHTALCASISCVCGAHIASTLLWAPDVCDACQYTIFSLIFGLPKVLAFLKSIMPIYVSA